MSLLAPLPQGPAEAGDLGGRAGRERGLCSFTLIANGMAADYETLAQQSSVPIDIVDIGDLVPSDWLAIVGLQQPGAAVIVRPDTHVISRCPGPTDSDWADARDALFAYARPTGIRT